ncbi:MAG TPA: diguanylate cyclase, partial [Gammaproteobacteria bacterium]|nr:diguanylate cyclase [Gammaproteobacteria bacterium]
RQKILVIDDTPANIQILHAVLRNAHTIFFATSGRDGIGMAQREAPDLILLDIMMPEMDGYEVCAELKSDPRTSQIPVIFITAMGSEEDEAKGLACGAVDYITKPISPPIVQARVRSHLELKRHRDALEELTHELEKKNRELAMLAMKDGLTGLANRRSFNEVLDAEINRARRSRRYLSLILCDVDFFKSYNDHYGHVAGDGCLQAIGELLLATFKRASDLPARYGGEEFAVILPDIEPADAVQLAERLRQEMAVRNIPHAFSAAAPHVTLSFGVVGAKASRERNAAWYVNEADKALYRAKEGGRNRVAVAEAFES